MPEAFGTLPDGREATLYRLENEHLRVAVTDFGGRIVAIEAADRSGRRDHVVLGFDSVSGYWQARNACFGALLGRVSNRIGGGRFTLDGQTYALSKNDGEATLHGGKEGFDKLFWHIAESGPGRLALTLSSPDGDQGFPGAVSATAAYRLDGDTLWLEFEAVTDRATPLNLSAHPYFNLGGAAAGDVLGHSVQIAADTFLPTDASQIPTGEIRPVADTPFDFREPTPIGARIRRPHRQLLIGRGYDHYFVLREPSAGTPRPAARAADPRTGRVLEILTTYPGVQFYSGNKLNGSVAGRGGVFRQSAGLAFEPQGFPDAPNRPQFPSTVLRPGARYREAIGYRLRAE